MPRKKPLKPADASGTQKLKSFFVPKSNGVSSAPAQDDSSVPETQPSKKRRLDSSPSCTLDSNSDDPVEPSASTSLPQGGPDDPHDCCADGDTVVEASSSTSPHQDGSSSLLNCKEIDFGLFLKEKGPSLTLKCAEKDHLLRNHWKPHVDFQFPSKMMHNRNRKFRTQWLELHPWLVYSPTEDGVFCKYCVVFAPPSDNLGKFVKLPCTNWNKASDLMKEHMQKKFHQDAQAAAEHFLHSIKKPEENISAKINAQAADNIAANRQVLTSLFRITEVLGRQGLAFRGNNDDGVLEEENRSNFNALLQLAINSGDVNLKKHLEKNTTKRITYVSKTTQNKLIDVLGDHLRGKILCEVKKAKIFCLLADEVSDSSNWEQLSVVLRFVDQQQKIREDFIGFIKCEDTRGETLFNKLKDQLTEWGLDINNIRGQGYDGASNMAGRFKGVQARFQEENEQALYFHCASHCLSLCVVKACGLSSVKNMMGTLKELSLFFSLSPKRQRKLEEVIKESQSDMKKTKLVDLCRTRWVEKHQALETFSELHIVVYDCLGQMCEESDCWDSETLTKATGFLHTIASSTFLVAFVVVRNCLRYLKPLTVKLQKKAKDIVQAYTEIKDVTLCLLTIREDIDTAFSPWFEEVKTIAGALSTDVSVPRQASRQTNRDNQPATTTEDFFKRSIAIPFLDHLGSELKDRFKNAGLAIDGLSLVPTTFAQDQNQLGEVPEGLRFLAQLWKTDLPDPACVVAEYHRWVCKWRRAVDEGTDLPSSVMGSLQKCSADFFPNLHTLLRLICTLPVTTAEYERTISHIRTLKSYLRSTMGQQRLNGLALLNSHRRIPVDHEDAVNSFARRFNTQMIFLPKSLVELQ